MNASSPLAPARIRSLTHPGEDREVQMIVSIDQSGKHHEAREIYRSSIAWKSSHFSDPGHGYVLDQRSSNGERAIFGAVGRTRDTGAFKCDQSGRRWRQ